MRNYQEKKYRKILQPHVYQTALRYLKSYDALQEDLQNIIDEQHRAEVPIKNRTPSNPTLSIVERRENKYRQVQKIRTAFEKIPEEYRKMVELNTVKGVPMKDIEGASHSTLSRYRIRLVLEVARNFELITEYEYSEALKGLKNDNRS